MKNSLKINKIIKILQLKNNSINSNNQTHKL